MGDEPSTTRIHSWLWASALYIGLWCCVNNGGEYRGWGNDCQMKKEDRCRSSCPPILSFLHHSRASKATPKFVSTHSSAARHSSMRWNSHSPGPNSAA